MWNLPERWRQYRALSHADRRLLWQALRWLAMVGLALRLMGFKRTQAWLQKPFDPSASQSAAAAEANGKRPARRVAYLVSVAARFGPYRATCLPRSLTLQKLLQRQGLSSTLCIGVRKRHGALEAHAWVERGGHPLIDGPEVREQFAAFDQPVNPDRWV